MSTMPLWGNFPEAQMGHSGLGTGSLGLPGEPRWEQRVTLDLDPGLGVTQGPDVHHHVHAAGGEVLVVW